VWLSVWSEVQTCIWPSRCQCHLLSLASVKYRLVVPFRYRLTQVVPDKGPLNGCVCVCVLRLEKITVIYGSIQTVMTLCRLSFGDQALVNFEPWAYGVLGTTNTHMHNYIQCESKKLPLSFSQKNLPTTENF